MVATGIPGATDNPPTTATDHSASQEGIDPDSDKPGYRILLSSVLKTLPRHMTSDAVMDFALHALSSNDVNGATTMTCRYALARVFESQSGPSGITASSGRTS